jgi:CHASE2 domain-containing sensor protein
LEIAEQIRKIKSLQPAVIGVDLSFEENKDPLGDMQLKAEMLSDSLIVPGFTLDYDSDHKVIIKEKFLPKEYLLKNGGFINFPYDDDHSVIRLFNPFYQGDNIRYSSFAVRIAEIFSPASLGKIRERNNSLESINYYGSSEYYLNYTGEEFEKNYQNHQLGNVKSKIVLLGYFANKNDNNAKAEDMFFSPLNTKTKKKNLRDIYGVIIHANIISMILNEHDYITVLPRWACYLIGAILSILMNWLILYFHNRYKEPYHILFFFIELFATISVVFLFIGFYKWFNLKISLLPIILFIVLSIQMFDLYKILARYLNKHLEYKTIFSAHS